jgi:hypothetical protein
MRVFSERMVAEIAQTLWAALQHGEFIADAAELARTYRRGASGRWRLPAGCDHDGVGT